MSSSVLIYGGAGALGKTIVGTFKKANWTVISIDFKENIEATSNIILTKSTTSASLEVGGSAILKQVEDVLQKKKLDAIINVAGGWAGGNMASKDIFTNVELMYSQSVNSSVIASKLASLHLKEGGLLTLTGAAAAVDPTPGMIAYGMAKAAVHHLVKSLAEKDGGIPEKSCVTAILPITLDTPMNRQFMPKADFSTWTPLGELSNKLMDWAKGVERPVSGSLVKVVTKNSKTSYEFIKK